MNIMNSLMMVTAAVDISDLDAIRKKVYIIYSGTGESVNLLNQIADVMALGANEANIILGIWKMFLPLAYAMIVLFFVTDLVERATLSGGFRELGMEYWLSSLLKLILAEGLLSFGSKLVIQLLMFGDIVMMTVINFDIQDTPLGDIYL